MGTATRAEWFLVGSIVLSNALMLWNLGMAIWDLGWAETPPDVQEPHDWSARITEAWTRLWQMVLLELVQMLFLFIAVRLLFVRNRLSGVTNYVLIAIEYLLIALGVLLVYRRRKLLRIIRDLGGD